jgi:PmbA protein
MNTKEIAKQVIQTAKAEGTDFCEVVVSQNEFTLKRIKHGEVDQPPAGEQWSVDIMLVKDKRKTAVSFDSPLLAAQMIKDALKNLSLLPEQEIHLPDTIHNPVSQPANLYDEKTAHLNEEHLIEIIQQLNKRLEDKDLFLSGKITQGRGEVTYENSIGTSQTAKFTLAATGLFAFDSSDQSISAYASSGGSSIDHIETDRLVAELIQKCELQRGKKKRDLFADKKEGEELRIDVIVEPYFFGPIFEWLGFFGFNGLLVERGESFISNKLEKLVTGENITIADDPLNSQNRGVAFPFDFEGMPRTKLSLIEKGVAKNAVYDIDLAKTWQKQSTGNALPPSARSEGAAPFDLAIEGSETSIKEMIKNCIKPTLWITKLHYLGMKHYQTATMTGIAQHGVFLIENGEVISPVENLRFEESIPEALKRVVAMSPSRLVFDPLSLSFPTGTVAPAMKIKDFRFVGSTKRTTT